MSGMSGAGVREMAGKRADNPLVAVITVGRRLAPVFLIAVAGLVAAPAAYAMPAAGAALAGYAPLHVGPGNGGSGGNNSPVKQPVNGGNGMVNAPAAHSPVTFTGIQQVSSVSIATNTQNALCKKRKARHCRIRQNMWTITRNND